MFKDCKQTHINLEGYEKGLCLIYGKILKNIWNDEIET